MKRILIISSGSYIGSSLKKYMSRRAGYVTDTADIRSSALKSMKLSGYDCVVYAADTECHSDTFGNARLCSEADDEPAAGAAKKAALEGADRFIYLSAVSDDGSVPHSASDRCRRTERMLASLGSGSLAVAVIRCPEVYGGARTDRLCGFMRRVIDEGMSGLFRLGTAESAPRVKRSGKRKKALVIASVASMLNNFNRNNINLLEQEGYEITLAASFVDKDSISNEKKRQFRNEMLGRGFKVEDIDFSRTPSDLRRQLRSVMQTRRLLKENFDLVHCNSPICSAITRAMFADYRKKYGTKIIYTAHGFHFFKGAPLKNWLIYYPVERVLSHCTDVLITINAEDYERAGRSFHAKRTLYIPGIGVDTSRFNISRAAAAAKRAELGASADDIVLLSVGELIYRKNHEMVIRALAELFKGSPELKKRIKYVIVGMGTREIILRQLAIRLGLKDNVIFTGYRTDIPEILAAGDIFVFPSFQEGLPVALMEAMASGLPCIVSDIRGNRDLITDKKGGHLFPSNDRHALAGCIAGLLDSPEKMRGMGLYNREKIKAYDISIVNAMMKEIYLSVR